MVDRRSSAENESNNYIANDERTVSQKVDHDDLTNTETISQTSPPIVDLEIHDIEGIGPNDNKKA